MWAHNLLKVTLGLLTRYASQIAVKDVRVRDLRLELTECWQASDTFLK